MIETVIFYKLPRLTREEIQAMLQLHDIRESRVYQEALHEGEENGLKKGLKVGEEQGLKAGEEKGLARAIAKMAANKMSAEQIAAILELDVEKVRAQLLADSRP